MSETEVKPDLKKDFAVAVNGTLTVAHDASVSYEQVVHIAFPDSSAPDVTYSVTYRDADGPHGGKGMLVAGESVRVKKEGTSFNVYPTTRS